MAAAPWEIHDMRREFPPVPWFCLIGLSVPVAAAPSAALAISIAPMHSVSAFRAD